MFLPLFLHIDTLSLRSDTLATPASILPLLLDTWGDVLADSPRHQAHSLISHSAMVLGLLLRSTNGIPPPPSLSDEDLFFSIHLLVPLPFPGHFAHFTFSFVFFSCSVS